MEDSGSLYSLLGVNSDATQAEITRAFRLMARQVHPDKSSDPEAHKHFQTLNQAYKVLSDPMKRNMYDLTGDVEQSEEFIEAYRYYRTVYHQITPEEIDSFAGTYKDSDMEREDLINFYNEHNGNMTYILHCIPLSETTDLPRFWRIYDSLISDKTLSKKRAYKQTKKSVKDLEEGKSISKKKKKASKAIESDLVQAIRSKNRNKGDFLGYLENKYK